MSWWQELTDLVLPTDCAGCGAPRAALCARCEQELGDASSVRRVYPDPVPPGLPPVYAATAYADVVRAALLAHKERGALRLAAPLGAALAVSVRALVAARGELSAGPESGEPLVLVPIPSSGRAVAARGHDPTLRLTRSAARKLRDSGIAVQTLAGLRQARRVADQAGLSAWERARNLRGALAVPQAASGLLSGRPVLVVDDLLTTGASVSEGARALECVGAQVVGAGVVAASLGTGRASSDRAGG